MEIELGSGFSINADLDAPQRIDTELGQGVTTSGIDQIKLDGTPLPIVNKSVNIPIADRLNQKADKVSVYTKTETDNKLASKADKNNVYNKSEVYTKNEINNRLVAKQDKLISGQNIKTINNQSLLGSGNIEIQSGSSEQITEISISGDSGTLSQSQIADILDPTKNVVLNNDGEIFLLANKQSDLSYRTFLNLDVSMSETVQGKAIYVQLNQSAANYGQWSKDDVQFSGGSTDLPIKRLVSETGEAIVNELEDGTYIVDSDYIYLYNYDYDGISLQRGDLIYSSVSSSYVFICSAYDGVRFWQYYNYGDLINNNVATLNDVYAFDEKYEAKMEINHYPSNTIYILNLEDHTRTDLTLPATLITIAKATGINIDDGRYELIFTSPATPTSFNYPDTILWSGDDLVNGKFVPQANKRYWVTFKWDGQFVMANVEGADYVS